MLVRIRLKPAYQQNNMQNKEDGPQSNYQFFCAKVLDHSWKIENEILIDRLDRYKELMGYKDIPYEERIKQ